MARGKRSTSFFGIVLILFGVGLLMERFHLLPYGGATLFWLCITAFGFFLTVQAFSNKRAASVFLGSMMFFIGLAELLYRYHVVSSHPWNWPAIFFLALGLSLLMTYFYDPGRWVMLVLGLFFVLYGGLYFFWWWHVLSWQTFWQSTNYLLPALLVTTGIFFLFRRR